MNQYLKRILIITLIIVTLTSLGYFILNLLNGVQEDYSWGWISMTISESKCKGALIRELKNKKPTVLLCNREEIYVKECWIEAQTRLKYSGLFKSKFIRTNQRRLCFNLNKNLPEIEQFSYGFAFQKDTLFGYNGRGSELKVYSFIIDKDSIGETKIAIIKKENNQINITNKCDEFIIY